MGNGIDPTTAYDANGNIQRMQQWGLNLNSSSQIDDLSYQYLPNSNKLKSVTEATLGTTDNKLGDFTDKNTSNDDYSYDVNGNLNLDKNKNISSIAYNYLNLPQAITVTGKGTISYTYDAGGNKLRKQVSETGQPIKTTLYLGGSVYENDQLQFIGHEEGRIRFKPAAGTTPASFEYDYFIKDHLGNVRMVLTEEDKQDIYPAATLENLTYNGGTAISNEDDFYNINVGNIVLQNVATGIPAYENNNGNPPYNNNPHSNQTSNSARLYLLNATNNTQSNKTGLGILLKVMSGDKVNVFGNSYHKKPGSGYSSGTNPLSVSDIIDLFTATPAITDKGISTGQITGAAGFPVNMNTLLSNPPAQSSSRPRAGINWIVLDEQFRFVSGGFDVVGDAGSNTTGTFKEHALIGLEVEKNGYFYAWCSNESQYNVFFDNFQLIHDRSAILEETHYYPFGLVQTSISSKAAGVTANKENTFQNQRFDDDLGLNWVQFKWRNHDPQTGRFIEIDPLAEKYVYNSTYAFSENKVTAHVELEGLESASIQDIWRSAGITQSSGDEIARNVSLGMERAGKVSKDIITIAGGVTLIIASGGAAAPLFALGSGGIAIAGGTAKLVLDAQGNYNEADKVPTTLSGTAIFTINQAVGEDNNGNELISQEFQSVVEFTEGALTFNFKDFDKVSSAVKKANGVIAGVSLTIDGATVPQDVKTMLTNMVSSGNTFSFNNDKPITDHPEDNSAVRDAAKLLELKKLDK